MQDDNGWEERGGVGLAITGDTVIEAISSTSCVPLGPSLEITSTGGFSNVIGELDDVPVNHAILQT